MNEAEKALPPELWVGVVPLRDGSADTGGTLELTSAATRRAATQVSEQMLSGLGETLTRVCRTASAALHGENRPDELVVKFGLKVAAKAGNSVFLLTEASGEATIAVEARWTLAKPSGKGDERASVSGGAG